MAKSDCRSLTHALGYVLLGAIFLGMTAAVSLAVPGDNQRTFATPQEAIDAIIQASESNDTASLMKIFGDHSKDIVESGDIAQDKTDRAEFVRLARENLRVNPDPANPDRITFSIGEQDWPFPIPLVRKDDRWRFDSSAGRLEILAHRIGEDELDTVEACRSFVEAQLSYAAKPHDVNSMLEYAQRILSSPGKHDGLYTVAASDNLVPESLAEASDDTTAHNPTPYHGYYFRVLKAQGVAAVGGALSYVVNGKMIGGFAMIAWPAAYGESGIKTFIVSHEGSVYEKDLGLNTSILVKDISRFDPDASWRKVDLE